MQARIFIRVSFRCSGGLVAWREVVGLDLVMHGELVDDRAACLVHAEHLDIGGVSPELEDHLVKRGYRRDIPEVGAADIDHNSVQRFPKVKRVDELFRRSIEHLPGHKVGAAAAIIGHRRCHAEDLPDLPGKEDSAQQDTRQHADGKIVCCHHHSDCCQHHDTGGAGMGLEVAKRHPAEGSNRYHDHYRDERGHGNPAHGITQPHDQYPVSYTHLT